MLCLAYSQLCYGIMHGKVLSGELYAQRCQKLIYLVCLFMFTVSVMFTYSLLAVTANCPISGGIGFQSALP